MALDDVDRRLLNLMQGSFPIAPRPYRHVAGLAGISELEVMDRVKRLLEKRIIRQVTPIFDTRALGYSSMLVAAKVDPEYPHRAAQVINAHPGVSHNYLRNHDFNLWFTIATEPDSTLGLEGTLEVLARESGAESVRQLPTLRLFKIRMDLEMEGDTQALASAAEASEPIELEPQPYDERDIAVIRALQGDMPVVSEPYAPAAAELGIGQQEAAGPPRRYAGARDPAAGRGVELFQILLQFLGFLLQFFKQPVHVGPVESRMRGARAKFVGFHQRRHCGGNACQQGL